MVVRKDLHPSYQAIQAGHAAIQFQHDHPEISKEWHEKSKYLVYLSVDDESHLERLIMKAEQRDIKYSAFHEPDIDNQITAVAFEPSEASSKLLSNLPLALKSEELILKN